MTVYHEQGKSVEIITTPWDKIEVPNNDSAQIDESQKQHLSQQLLDLFSINVTPQLNVSYKPFVLLFDEFYTDLYRISEAQLRMQQADRIIFMGTSFSVNITQMALETAMYNNIPIEIVDPNPVDIAYRNTTYHKMKASEYIDLQNLMMNR